jgi:hypothetical protein
MMIKSRARDIPLVLNATLSLASTNTRMRTSRATTRKDATTTQSFQDPISSQKFSAAAMPIVAASTGRMRGGGIGWKIKAREGEVG